MRREESSIYIGLKRIRKAIRVALFSMNKTDRHFYGTEIIEAMNETFKHFVLAFEFKEERMHHMHGMIAWFAVLRDTLDFVSGEGLLHFHKRTPKPKKDKDGKETPRNPVEEIPTAKMELFKLIAQVDADITKWVASQRKGSTMVD